MDTVYIALARADSSAYAQFWNDLGLGFHDVAPFAWGMLAIFAVVRLLYNAVR